MDPLKNNVRKLSNDDWRSEVAFDLRYNRWLLMILGLWPPGTKFERILETFFIFSTLFLLGIFLVPHGAYIFLIERDRDLRLKMIGPLSFCVMALGKYGFALLHKRTIASCVDRMAEDWKSVTKAEDEKRFMIEAGRWCENFTKLCVTFMYGGAMSYSVLIPLLEQVSIIIMSPGNATRMLTFPCHFGVKTFDVSTDTGFIFEVLFATHAMSIFIMSTISTGMCVLMAKFVMHICGQLKIMMKYLRLTVKDDDDDDDDVVDERKSNFKVVVIKHLKILRFISDVEKALTAVCFVEYIGCTFNICLCGYYFITEMEKNDVPNATTYMVLIISFVTNIFVFCYLGERLTEQCQNVGSTTYEINWPLLLLKGNRITDVEMIIMISQHPPKLTAGKIFNLTMYSFTTVMKAAATYINMLRKVTSVA